ncbi:MAG: hypothetical protein JWQ70_201 [Aeromicrobium sp.]|nr:hypothetical protein [Aeromicrobium sp.]
MSWLLAIFAAVMALVAPAPPPVAGVADYQLGGAYRPTANVQIVTRDRADKPVKGTYSICYVNAFQTQPGELSWWKSHHPTLLLRNPKTNDLVHDPGWPDEALLDISTQAKRAAAADVVGRWFDGCAADGYQAVEPDNLDSWTRSRKLLTETDAIDFAKLLIDRAHRARLAIAQKNAAELSSKRLGFDFAVAEECEQYRECGAYTATYGKKVIEIEYADNGRAAFRRACKTRAGAVSILLRDRDVVPAGTKGYVFETC